MPSHPHDALFKLTFERPEHAADLLCSILPPTIARAIDWTSLTHEAGSFVDPELLDRHTDLLYAARLHDHDVLLYVLLEHQSSTDLDMPLRMLEYMLAIWRRWRGEHASTHLPPILPVVIAHDPRGWRGPSTMAHMFDGRMLGVAGFASFIPNFSLLVDDLTPLSNEELRARALAPFVSLALAALRDSRSVEQLVASIAHWSDALREVALAPTGMDALRALFRYFAEVTPDMTLETIHATLVQHAPEAEPAAMTLSETLRAEGRELGIQQGIEQGIERGIERGRVSLLLRQIELKFGAVDEAVIERIESATEAQLDQFAARILVVDTLDAMFA